MRLVSHFPSGLHGSVNMLLSSFDIELIVRLLFVKLFRSSQKEREKKKNTKSILCYKSVFVSQVLSHEHHNAVSEYFSSYDSGMRNVVCNLNM